MELLTPKQQERLDRSLRAYTGEDVLSARQIGSTHISDILVLNLELAGGSGGIRNCHAFIANRGAQPVIAEGWFGRGRGGL
ncbi:MAG: hypothetical protein FWE98_02995 [Oscillospiraceae bacterium]|nr:hypothetical protein [Oscillospiraceae bacterium]